MRSPTPPPVPDPWASDIDNGWRDLIVTSAPPPVPEAPAAAASPSAPPPMSMMRELATREIHLKNQSLPTDLNSWQEHGAVRAQELMRNEPGFSSGDRRLWLVAGTLMTLAVLVLGVLGLLTFGNGRVVESAVAAIARGEPIRPVEVVRPEHAAVGGVAAIPEARPPVAAPRAPRNDTSAIVTITHAASASSSSSRHHGSSSTKHRHHKSRDTASALP